MYYSGENGGFTDGQGNWWYFDGNTQQFVAWT
jgi:D-alanyl-D-alanine dipeptidase